MFLSFPLPPLFLQDRLIVRQFALFLVVMDARGPVLFEATTTNGSGTSHALHVCPGVFAKLSVLFRGIPSGSRGDVRTSAVVGGVWMQAHLVGALIGETDLASQRSLLV